MPSFRRFLVTAAARMGYRVFSGKGRYDQDGLFTIHSDAFRRTPAFRAAYERGLRTVSRDPGHEWRVHIALWCAHHAARLEGDFVECGVFVGFMSSAVLASLDWDRLGKTLWLVDTFQGPDVNQYTEAEIGRGRIAETESLRGIGGYDYDLESVKRNFSQWKNVEFVKGRVPESLGGCRASRIAYLHLDMNAVVPETAALRHFWDRVVPGGVILLDDYCYAGFEEQRLGYEQVAADLGVSIASLPTGQGLLLKPPVGAR